MIKYKFSFKLIAYSLKKSIEFLKKIKTGDKSLKMMKYKSSLKLIVYSLKKSIEFLKKIKIGENSLKILNLKKKPNKNIILWSSHVNKKAFNQIKPDHISNLRFLKNKIEHKKNIIYIFDFIIFFFIK